MTHGKIIPHVVQGASKLSFGQPSVKCDYDDDEEGTRDGLQWRTKGNANSENPWNLNGGSLGKSPDRYGGCDPVFLENKYEYQARKSPPPAEFVDSQEKKMDWDRGICGLATTGEKETSYSRKARKRSTSAGYLFLWDIGSWVNK